MDEGEPRAEEEEEEVRKKASFVNESYDDVDLFGPAPDGAGGGEGGGRRRDGRGGGGGGVQDMGLFSEVKGSKELDDDPFGARGGEFAEPPSHRPTTEEPKLEFFERRNSSSEEGGERDDQSQGFVTLSPPLTPQKDADLAAAEKDSPDIVKSKVKLLPSHFTNATSNGEREAARDLVVSITEREKQGAKTDSYVTYKICTECKRPHHLYNETHYDVWRRYRDFEWLRAQIEKTHPTLIMPPLPGKQLTRFFDHMSEEFLRERQKALEKFLWRLTGHPYFSYDKTLHVFLTATTERFTAHVMESTAAATTRFFGIVSSTVKQATTAFKMKNPDQEFSKHTKYFASLAELMSVLERVGTRLHQERSEFAIVLDDFSTALFGWATNESMLQHSLQRVAGCVETCCVGIGTLNDANAATLLVAMREYQLYCSAAVSALRRRDALQLESESLRDDRDRKKKVHDEATVAGKTQKVAKVAAELEKVSVSSEQALDDLAQANEQLRVDVEKWHEAKEREIREVMQATADNHITFHQKCFGEWEKVLKMVRSVNSTDSVGLSRDITNSDSFSNLEELRLPSP